MRNLKKFLALVLAMMMVMGLMVTANATGYTDDAAIAVGNREAIEVLSAVGVFEGDDGSFNPKNYIRRSEFAIVLYKLASGDVTEKNPLLNALDDQFSDVITGDNRNYGWAAPYVNYSAFKTWFEGDSGVGGTFRPGSNVSYYEVLVSILRVLELADDIGDDWKFDTAEKATKLGLTKGIDSLVGYATREDVARMTFNALTYTEEHGTIYFVWKDQNDNNAYDEGEKLYEGSNEYIAIATAAANEGAVTTETRDLKGSLADINFYGLHEAGAPGSDQFMRPTTVWVDEYTTVANPVVEIPWTPDYSYNGNFTYLHADTIQKANGGTTPTVYYNGVQNNGLWKSMSIDGVGGLWNGTNPATSVGIPGLEVFVYNMGGAVGYRVVVREARVGQITQVAGSGNSYQSKVDVYETSGGEITESQIKVTYTLTQPAGTSKDYYTNAYNLAAASSRGTIVAVYVQPGWENAATGVNDHILEVAPLTAVPTTITRIDDNGQKINSVLTTANGAFQVSNAALWTASRNSDNEATILNPKFNNSNYATRNIKVGTATLYTLNGSVLFIDQCSAPAAAATTGYGYLYDINEVFGGWRTEQGTMFKVRLYLEDEVRHEVNAVLYDGASAGDLQWNASERVSKIENDDAFDTKNGGVFVYYQLDQDSDGNDYYMLAVADGNGLRESDTTPGEYVQKYGTAVTIKPGVAQGKISEITGGEATDSNLVFDNATTFYVVTGEAGAESVKVYTGVSALPSAYATVSGTNWAKIGPVAVAMRDDVGSAKVVRAMVLRAPSAGTSGVSGGYFIVGSDTATYVSVIIGSRTIHYRQYKAVVNGETTTVLVTNEFDEASAGSAATKVAGLTSVTYNSTALAAGVNVINTNSLNPQIADGFRKITNLNVKDVARGTIVLDDNIDGYLITNNLQVFKYDTTGYGSVEQIAVTDVKNGMNGYFTLDNDGVLTTLYVTTQS